MRRSGTSFAVLIALALLAAAGSASAQEADSSRRTVAVVGRGAVTVFPDTASIRFGVRVVDPIVTKAKAAVDKAVAGVLQACDALAIDRAAVTATALTVNPKYDYDIESDRSVLVGYEVTRSVEVSLTQLALFNDLVQRSIDAGANEIKAVELKSSKASDLTLQALSKAIHDAKSQAEYMARELGKQLGEVGSISTQEADWAADNWPVMSPVTSREQSVEFRPGPIEVSAVVLVVFSLK